VLGIGRTRDDDCVQQAWASVQREHGTRPETIEEVYAEWQPSGVDAGFLARTFPNAEVTYSFARPGPDGWDAAFAAAAATIAESMGHRPATEFDERNRHVRETGVLLPVLWSHSSPWQHLLAAVPHSPVVPGRLSVGVGMVGPTPRGTIGISHVTVNELAGRSFDELLQTAFGNLIEGLRVEVSADRDAPHEGSLVFVRREGGNAAAAVALPNFHGQMSRALGRGPLLAGLVDPDVVVLAAEESPLAARVHQFVLEANVQPSEMVPMLLRITEHGTEILIERADR
jgi:hypothetical protein